MRHTKRSFLARLTGQRLVSEHENFLTDGGPTNPHRAIRLCPRRCAASYYERTRRDAFLIYPTIPLSLIHVFPDIPDTEEPHSIEYLGVDLAREPLTDENLITPTSEHSQAAHIDLVDTEKVVRIWKRYNGGDPEKITLCRGEGRFQQEN